MSRDDTLEALARAYGIVPSYVNEQGESIVIPLERKEQLLKLMGVATEPGEIDTSLRNAPEPPPAPENVAVDKSGFWPRWLVDSRVWGLTCQLYSLRSARNWGIGDFEDLARLAEIAARHGADFIGLSPLHALFVADPDRFSPYAPSSRIFLNPLFIAPDRLPWADGLFAANEAELGALRRTKLVDYRNVYAVKLRALKAVFDRFQETASPAERESFAAYRAEQGEPLLQHAIYEALSEHFVAQGGHVAWSTWPEEYRDPANVAVRDFARAQKNRIAFHIWLQWIAGRQLAEAQARAKAAGMRIGLYLDLAVGVSPDGSRAWINGKSIARQARIGAPPDALGPEGQDWGLVPFSPRGLAEESIEPFRALLRANMRHAGAMRLDHAMGLQRLFWIPEGESARHGAYVRYPFREMLEAVAEESWMFRCIVIGEDLGTLPPGFTDTIVRAGLLSYQVLYFTRHDGHLLPPHAYRREALACVSTHDLPTLKGWWTGSDINCRAEAGRCTREEAGAQLMARDGERRALLRALAEAGLTSLDPEGPLPEVMPDDLLVAAHRFVARTPSRLFAVQIEDALGQTEQANLPGTTGEHPNWRRKIGVPIEELEDQSLFRSLTGALAEERPKA